MDTQSNTAPANATPAGTTQDDKLTKYPANMFPIDKQLPESNKELYALLKIDDLCNDAYTEDNLTALKWIDKISKEPNEDGKKTSKGELSKFPFSEIKRLYFEKFKGFVPTPPIPKTPEPPKPTIAEEYINKLKMEKGISQKEIDNADKEVAEIRKEQKAASEKARKLANAKKTAVDAKKAAAKAKKAAEEADKVTAEADKAITTNNTQTSDNKDQTPVAENANAPVVEEAAEAPETAAENQ